MTAGHLDADKAFKMYQELNSREILFPGNMKWGDTAASADLLGGVRQAFRENKIAVPGSHDVAMEALAMFESERGRVLPSQATKANELVEFIKSRAFEPKIVIDPPTQVVTKNAMGADVVEMVPAMPREEMVPRDMTLDEIDETVRAIDGMTYTEKGFDKQLNKIWKRAVKKSRRMFDDVLQTTPEGAMFKDMKSRHESLSTAGSQRGQLGEWIARTGKVVGILTLEPATLAAASLSPSSYTQALAALRVPRSVMEPLAAAHASGRLAIMRDALVQIAEKYPVLAERVVRGTALVSGKPEGRQFLTDEETNSLSARRSFDPGEIAAERQRLKADKSLSSIEKAKRLTSINENGYVVTESMPLPQGEDNSMQQVFGGEEGLQQLMQALKSSGAS
jgi:hypothetical protein